MKNNSRPLLQKRLLYSLGIICILLIYIWAFQGISFSGFKETTGKITISIFKGLFRPDWDFVYDSGGEDLLRALLDTVSIALLATVFASLMSLPLAFGAAKNISPFHPLIKFLLSCLRTFPELVMALLFVVAVGPGAFAGVLALCCHSVGILGKLYYETLENFHMRGVEALAAAGANQIQIIRFAILPGLLYQFLSHTLYRLEVNTRAATILGMIGAGGIGTPLLFALSTRHWERVGIILLGIITMVTTIDLISSQIRKKLV